MSEDRRGMDPDNLAMGAMLIVALTLFVAGYFLGRERLLEMGVTIGLCVGGVALTVVLMARITRGGS